MKKFFSYVLVALVFCICGYLIGSSSNIHFSIAIQNKAPNEIIIANYSDAYSKGWAAWFFGYGMNGEGQKYLNNYIYGRNYNHSFSSEKEAFSAGYKDGFYSINHRDPDDYYNNAIDKAYEQYFHNK